MKIIMVNYVQMACVLGIVGVFGLITYNDVQTTKAKADIDKVRLMSREIVVQDLNGNGIPERFYEFNGKKAFLEIDGKNLEATLK